MCVSYAANATSEEEQMPCMQLCSLCLLTLPSHSADRRQSTDFGFSMNVGKAIMSNDHYSFFKLYENAPKMAGYVMDFFVVRSCTFNSCVKVRADCPCASMCVCEATHACSAC